MDTSVLKGLFPPLVTPVTENEDIDEGALRSLVNHCIEKKIHGILLLRFWKTSITLKMLF